MAIWLLAKVMIIGLGWGLGCILALSVTQCLYSMRLVALCKCYTVASVVRLCIDCSTVRWCDCRVCSAGIRVWQEPPARSLGRATKIWPAPAQQCLQVGLDQQVRVMPVCAACCCCWPPQAEAFSGPSAQPIPGCWKVPSFEFSLCSIGKVPKKFTNKSWILLASSWKTKLLNEIGRSFQ